MMDCRGALGFVDSWEGSGGIPPAREDFVAFMAHLATCPSCSMRWTALLPLLEADHLGSLPSLGPALPPSFADIVLASLPAAPEPAKADRQRPFPPSPTLLRRALLAAGIAAVFALGLGTGRFLRGADEELVAVRFAYEGSGASSIALVGDFNSWDPRGYSLRRAGDSRPWEITVKLKRSRLYSYGFIIDGVRFVPDPSVTEKVDDGFGNSNSLLRL